MRIAATMILIALAGSYPAGAQISIDEARQRLLDRQARRLSQTQPATAPSPGPAQADDPELSQALHDAWGHLLAREFAIAIPMFTRVMKTDPANVSALEGRGICNYELSKYQIAVDDLDRALGLASKNPRLVRQASIAAAVAAIGAGKPLPAVKIAHDSLKLEDKAGTLDEELLNVLGTALWRCKADARNLPWVRASGKYYMEYDGKLAEKAAEPKPRYFGYDAKNVEEKNGLKRRWGTLWLAGPEADARWQAYGNAVAVSDAAAAQLDLAVALLKVREQQYDQRRDQPHPIYNWPTADNLRDAQLAEAAARANLKAAAAVLQATEAPPFPVKLEPVWAEPLSLSTSPPTRIDPKATTQPAKP